MDLTSALDWLYSTQLFGIKLGLEGTVKLLSAVDVFPSQGGQVVHVAGTNGKGSTCAMMESLAREAGYKTGLFTSPHLVDFSERIRVNGQMIPEGDLLRILARVKETVQAWEPHPTFFELTLAIALCYFKEQGVNFLILETGLGGRLDATNALPKDIAVLAPIGMDHQQYLGDTLAKIAGEKAGIIAMGKPVVSARQEPEALAVIEQMAHEKASPLVIVADDYAPQPSLAGRHQRENAALALLTMRTLGVSLSVFQIAQALSRIVWRGRFELLDDGMMVLDGAHNPHAAKVLVATWRDLFAKEKAIIVFAASADKNIKGVLDLIAPLASEWHLVPCSSPRILPVNEMSALIASSSDAPIFCHETLEDGLASAKQSGQRVLVTGSLFLLGDVLSSLNKVAHRQTMQ
ncbi:MAG: folylpolyglutamate synthase/dihydrofolate synthase family protein [Akkermansia sp.]